jgi:hypothetical protein
VGCLFVLLSYYIEYEQPGARLISIKSVPCGINTCRIQLKKKTATQLELHKIDSGICLWGIRM